MHQSQPSSPDYRRTLVLIMAIVLLGISAAVTFMSGSNSGRTELIASATGRIGLVLSALWLAWPTLKKPASWLPPGFAVMCVIALIVLAAQPRLIIVAIPALGVLLAIATLVRSLKQ